MGLDPQDSADVPSMRLGLDPHDCDFTHRPPGLIGSSVKYRVNDKQPEGVLVLAAVPVCGTV